MTRCLTMENIIRAFAGSFILISLALGYLYSPYWYLFTALSAWICFNQRSLTFAHWKLSWGIWGLGANPQKQLPLSDKFCTRYYLRSLPWKVKEVQFPVGPINDAVSDSGEHLLFSGQYSHWHCIPGSWLWQLVQAVAWFWYTSDSKSTLHRGESEK